MSDEDLYRRLRAGEEAAFRELLHRYHARLAGLARSFLGDAAIVDEVVQETWVAAIEGLADLRDPSALRPWLFGILANKARGRASRDRRMTALSDLIDERAEHEPAVDPDSFTKRGFWTARVPLWDELDPERIVAGRQLWELVREAIEELPPAQRAVILLRDMEGLEPAQVCGILDIGESHRRVLLHRARARLRRRIEALLGESR